MRGGKMINLLWVLMIISGIVFFILNGRADELLSVMGSSAENSIELLIGLAGIMAVWSGVMKICEKSGLVQSISKILSIPMRVLFPGLEKKSNKALGSIIMNISTNLMGLSNAATPFGIKAMEELQLINENKERASDYMVNFLIINAACIQLLPTTVISIMASLKSTNPAGIIIPTIITTIIALTAGLISSRILKKFYR
jgi:spore maturation protein A